MDIKTIAERFKRALRSLFQTPIKKVIYNKSSSNDRGEFVGILGDDLFKLSQSRQYKSFLLQVLESFTRYHEGCDFAVAIKEDVTMDSITFTTIYDSGKDSFNFVN